jgi:microcystin-dependent protein
MDNYIGEIRMFASNYAPDGWAFCDGKLLNISEYQALYTLLGTTYGGNGTTTFALPDLRSRIPVGMGQGNGLANYPLGQTGGEEFVTLTTANMPMHSHSVMASSAEAAALSPAGAVYATVPAVRNNNNTFGELYTEYATPPLPAGYTPRTFAAGVVQSTGITNAIHENRMPTMPINFIIALTGVFPFQN